MEENEITTNASSLPQTSVKQLTNTILHVNRAYQETLNEKIENLQKRLKYNLYLQDQLNKKISNSKSLIVNKISNFNTSVKESTPHAQNEQEINKIKENYFKDRFGGCEPPDNSDTIEKRRLHFYSFMPSNSNEWTLKFRNELKKSVLSNCIKLLKTPHLNKIDLLKEKLNKLKKACDLEFENYEQYVNIKALLKQARLSIKKIETLSEMEVLSQVDFEKIDWMKISKIDLKNNFSSRDCRLVWKNICCPTINQTKWTHTENENLIELARFYSEKNWEKITIDLKTNRSAYLCMKRYHEKTADKYCKRDWSEEETLELNELADTHRIGLFIPYNYICYLIGTRDRNTVYNRHMKINTNLNHGKWLLHEENALHEALQYYNFNTKCNWQAISEHVGTRSALQCKDRFELKYVNPDKYINWTLEDDIKLLESYREYGAQWSKIAKEVFPMRNNHSCLFRFNKLMHWKRQNVWFENQSEEIKEFILFIFKKKRKNVDDNDQVFTSYGDIVPKIPKFGSGLHNLGNIINQIYDKKPLIDEFINKKRQGQLSLTLLDQIGISTPLINALVEKYKNQFLKETDSKTTKKIVKITREKKLKLPKKSKESKMLKPKFKGVINTKSHSPREKRSNSKKIKALLQLNETKKKVSPKSIKSRLNENSKRVAKGKNTKEKLENRVKKITVKDALIQNIFNYSKLVGPLVKTEADPQKTKKLTINQILENLHQNNKMSNNKSPIEALDNQNQDQNIQPTTSSSLNDTDTFTDNYTNFISKQNSLNEDNQSKILEESLNKVTLAENTSRLQSIETINTEKSQNELLRNQISNNIAIVNLNVVEDGTKIPCFREQFNELKYTYSLKKAENCTYFQKHTILNCNGKFVAIQYTKNLSPNEILTAKRISAIEKVLKNIK